MKYQISEINRKLSSLINIGEVVEIEKGRVQVKLDSFGNEDFITDFLPYLTNINATSSVFVQAKKGALALILSIDGDLTQGIVLGFLEKNENQVNFEEDKYKVNFTDGANIVYNTATQELNISGIKKINFNVDKIELSGNFATNGNIKAGGDVSATGDLKTSLLTLNTHIHTCSAPGTPSTPGTAPPPPPTI